MKVQRVDLINWALRTSQNSPQGLNISSIRVFEQIRDPEIPITLRSLVIGYDSLNYVCAPLSEVHFSYCLYFIGNGEVIIYQRSRVSMSVNVNS